MLKHNLPNAESLVMTLLAIPGPSGEEEAISRQIAELLRGRRAAGKPAIRPGPSPQPPRRPGRQPGLQAAGHRAGPAAAADGPRRYRAAVPRARPVRRGRWIVPADKDTALGADDRAGAAVILYAALEILRRGLPHPPVTFLWTVQEEIGLYGARHGSLGLLGKPALAFNFDGGSIDKVTIGATGGYRLNIHVSGRASHAGVAPEEGINAITIAALAIARLHRGRWLGKIDKGGHRGTSNIGVIRGGEATNVVTPAAELRAEARSHDPAFRRQIVRAIERPSARPPARCASSRAATARSASRAGWITSRSAWQTTIPRCWRRRRPCAPWAASPPAWSRNGGLDANWMTARGIPTVTLGCGQSDAHTTAERLDLDEFEQGCRLALRLACGG